MRITLHADYPQLTHNQTPKYIEWTQDATPIHAYVNDKIFMVQKPSDKAIALLIEPRSIMPDLYPWIKQYYSNFRYVFTHDSELLETLPNAKLLLFGGVWGADPDRPKTKDISMISSNKRMCQLHIDRMNLARQLEGKIDTFGTYKGEWISTEDAHAPYRFAVVIENYIDDYWFTEKICNCFANKTVPIYYGARKIDDFFNQNGIIHVNKLNMIPIVIDNLLSSGPEKVYDYNRSEIEDNYNRVQKYRCFEDWFYRTYKDLLEVMLCQ